MQKYLKSGWVRAGLVGLVLGTGPLASVMIAARLGFTDDPNPNPVYHGMLAGLTFWPSIALIAIGIWRHRKQSRSA